MTYSELLLRLAQTDPAVVVLTAENRAHLGNLPASLGQRFIDVGICEQTLVGASAGLALRGRVPIAHALASFLTMRAFEFIRTDIGLPGLPVVLVGSVPGFLSTANGPTHQALEDVALMRGIPNFQIFCPSDLAELAAGLPHFVASRRPTYVRYFAGPVSIQHLEFEIGRAERLASGRDATLLTYGFLLTEAMKAVRGLRNQGRSVGLLNLRSLSPIDEAAILDAAQQSRCLVTIEDHFQTGGLHSIVCEILVRHRLSTRVLPLALNKRWFRPALLEQVLELEGFTADRMVQEIASQV